MEQMLKDHAQSFDSTYVFSSEQQAEVKRLYQKYASSASIEAHLGQERKIAQLRALDRSVQRAGLIAALLVILLGAGIHSTGIALAQQKILFTQGAVIAAAGLLLLLLVYPTYVYAMKRQRERASPEIIRLCTELMK